MTTDELIRSFIGKKVVHNHGRIYGENDKARLQLILDVRGWGAIQNLFDKEDADWETKLSNAAMFQDEMALWIVDAINQKLNKKHDG